MPFFMIPRLLGITSKIDKAPALLHSHAIARLLEDGVERSFNEQTGRFTLVGVLFRPNFIPNLAESLLNYDQRTNCFWLQRRPWG